jgi:hypothetical protein
MLIATCRPNLKYRHPQDPDHGERYTLLSNIQELSLLQATSSVTAIILSIVSNIFLLESQVLQVSRFDFHKIDSA